MMSALVTIRDSDIETRTLAGYITVGKAVRVVDGDTVYLVASEPLVPDQFMKVNCRLAGIDTPEMTKQPEAAKIARNVLANLAMDVKIDYGDMRASRQMQSIFDENKKLLYVKFLGNDKYGRELVELYSREEDVGVFSQTINARMITSGVAKPYDGGAKLV